MAVNSLDIYCPGDRRASALLLPLLLGGCLEKADILQTASYLTYSERCEAISILSAPEGRGLQDAVQDCRRQAHNAQSERPKGTHATMEKPKHAIPDPALPESNDLQSHHQLSDQLKNINAPTFEESMRTKGATAERAICDEDRWIRAEEITREIQHIQEVRNFLVKLQEELIKTLKEALQCRP